jgi:hypothetical protein
MKPLKKLFDFYLNSSIHVALAVCCLTYITYVNFNLPKDKTLLFFIFFATITGYNFIKYFGITRFHYRKLSTDLKLIQIFSLFCFIALAYFTFQLNQKTIIYLAGLGIVTFFYAVPFLPKKYFSRRNKNLRAIAGLKIYIIAIVWAVTTVIIPFINANHTIQNDELVATIQLFLYVLVAILPFEIRDIQYDSLNLVTIPQKIGVKRTKVMGTILLFPFCLIELFKDEIEYQRIIIIVSVAIMTLIFLIFSRVTQSQYYTSFFVEGIPIIWLILILL